MLIVCLLAFRRLAPLVRVEVQSLLVVDHGFSSHKPPRLLLHAFHCFAIGSEEDERVAVLPWRAAAIGEDTRADAARRSLDGAGLDRHAETTASRQITSALAYALAAGDIVAIIGRPSRGKTWASERYCAGRTNAFYLAVSSAVFSLPGLLSLVGEASRAGRHHRSALEAERTIIDRLHDRQALIVVDEAHHLRDKLLDELRIIRHRAGCGLALVADETIRMALARCQQVDGRIGLKIDLATQPMTDVEDIADGVLGRRPCRVELKTLNAVGRGPGGLHAMRRLLGRAWMVAQARPGGDRGRRYRGCCR